MKRIWGCFPLLLSGLVGCADQAVLGNEARAVEGESLDGESCEFYETAIVDSHDGPFASVTVTNDDVNLNIEVTTTLTNIHLRDLYLDATVGDITHNSSGFINYLFFPFQAHFTAPLPTSHTFQIPLADVGLEDDICGSSIKVALYSLSRIVIDGVEQGSEKGWATGPFICPENDLDGCTWSVYDFCECAPPPPPPPPPPPSHPTCPQPPIYWKTHNEYATQPALQIDWPAPRDENETLCGRTALSILSSPARDTWSILANQTIAASLNVANGVPSHRWVPAALASGHGLLVASCRGIRIRDALEALFVSTVLAAYNHGVLGPSQCHDGDHHDDREG